MKQILRKQWFERAYEAALVVFTLVEIYFIIYIFH